MNGRDALAQIDAVFADLDFALDRLFKITGDNRVRHAACVLRGRNGGAPQIDDDEAIDEIERLIAAGKPLRDAVAIVARRYETANIESVKHRLRRKLREKSRTQRLCPAAERVSLADDGNPPEQNRS